MTDLLGTRDQAISAELVAATLGARPHRPELVVGRHRRPLPSDMLAALHDGLTSWQLEAFDAAMRNPLGVTPNTALPAYPDAEPPSSPGGGARP